MKGFFSRIENWLLIVPFILLLIENIFYAGQAFDFHLHDTYFVISGSYIGIAILLFCWILYLCHFSLRARKSGNKKILAAHVMATVGLLSFLFVFNVIVPGWDNTSLQPRQYYEFSSWQSLQRFPGDSVWIGSIFLAFVLIQILFICYTIIRMVVKK